MYGCYFFSEGLKFFIFLDISVDVFFVSCVRVGIGVLVVFFFVFIFFIICILCY